MYAPKYENWLAVDKVITITHKAI